MRLDSLDTTVRKWMIADTSNNGDVPFFYVAANDEPGDPPQGMDGKTARLNKAKSIDPESESVIH